MHHRANFVKIGQTIVDIASFVVFTLAAAVPSSWISKIRNFNHRSAVRSQCATQCHISSTSVKRLQLPVVVNTRLALRTAAILKKNV